MSHSLFVTSKIWIERNKNGAFRTNVCLLDVELSYWIPARELRKRRFAGSHGRSIVPNGYDVFVLRDRRIAEAMVSRACHFPK